MRVILSPLLLLAVVLPLSADDDTAETVSTRYVPAGNGGKNMADGEHVGEQWNGVIDPLLVDVDEDAGLVIEGDKEWKTEQLDGKETDGQEGETRIETDRNVENDAEQEEAVTLKESDEDDPPAFPSDSANVMEIPAETNVNHEEVKVETDEMETETIPEESDINETDQRSFIESTNTTPTDATNSSPEDDGITSANDNIETTNDEDSLATPECEHNLENSVPDPESRDESSERTTKQNEDPIDTMSTPVTEDLPSRDTDTITSQSLGNEGQENVRDNGTSSDPPPAENPLTLEHDEEEKEAEKEKEEEGKEKQVEKEEKQVEKEKEEKTAKKIVVNYAHKNSGAIILDFSPTFKGTANLLTSSKDQYAIAPCSADNKFVVLGLSEDILVKEVVLANYERYSSKIRDFQILASQTFPEGTWHDLGVYTALAKHGEQAFELKEPAWARYLKLKFLTHYGEDIYCTVSQVMVHGSTMTQGFHEQWERENMHQQEMDLDPIEEEDDEGDGRMFDSDQVISEEGFDQPEEVIEEEEQIIQSEQIIEENDVHSEEENEKEGVVDQIGEREQITVQGGMDSEKEKKEEASHDVEKNDAEKGKEKELLSTNEVDVEEDEGLSATLTDTNALAEELQDTVGSSLTEVPKEESIQRSENDVIQEATRASINIPDTQLPSKEVSNDPIEAHDIHSLSQKLNEDDVLLTEEEMKEVYSQEDRMSVENYSYSVVSDAVKAAVTESGAAVSDTMKKISSIIKTKIEEATSSNASVELNEISNNSGMLTQLDNIHKDGHTEGVFADPKNSETASLPDPAEKMGSTSNPATAAHGEDIADHRSSSQKQEKATDNSLSRTDLGSSDVKTETAKATVSSSDASHTAQKHNPHQPHSDRQNQQEIIIPKTIIDALHHVLSGTEKHVNPLFCLENLQNFTEYKARKIAKIKQKTPPTASSSSGGVRIEPIFKTLTDEIKSLQMHQSIQDYYIKALVNCYNHVLMDSISDVQRTEKTLTQRIDVLESFISEIMEERISAQKNKNGWWIVAMDFIQKLASVLHKLFKFLLSWGGRILRYLYDQWSWRLTSLLEWRRGQHVTEGGHNRPPEGHPKNSQYFSILTACLIPVILRMITKIARTRSHNHRRKTIAFAKTEESGKRTSRGKVAIKKENE